MAVPTPDGMSPEREELLRLVEEIPDQDVPAVLADVRRRLESSAGPVELAAGLVRHRRG